MTMPTYEEIAENRDKRLLRPATSQLDTVATLLYTLAALVGVGCVITGIALATHSIPSCSPNLFDSSLVDCSESTHPFVGAGIGLVVGGLVQAGVITAIARLARVLRVVRATTSVSFES